MGNETIHTLEARSNVLLEVAQNYFGLGTQQMFHEINALFFQLLEILKTKKIEYKKLKSALVSYADRNEVVFVFDTAKIQSPWYGREIFERLIPLFHDRVTCSVLCGDYIGENYQQEYLFEALSQSITLVRDTNYIHSSQFFLVYMNNQTDGMVNHFNENLMPYDPYIGSINLNFSSFMKTYISSILCRCFLKLGKIIINEQEDDLDINQDINILGYPFEEYGYVCKSIPSDLYGLFLSYKIEREVIPGLEADTSFSINAITPTVLPLADFKILIEDLKLNYLITGDKSGVMKRTGLLNVDKREMEGLIKNKVNSNYIYNLNYNKELDTIKFNILIELKAIDTGQHVKLTIALEYIPNDKMLRLITMY